MIFNLTIGPVTKEEEAAFMKHDEFKAMAIFGPSAMKFIALCYDGKGEMVARYPSIKRRKTELITLLGLEKLEEDLIVFIDERLVNAAFKYLLMQDDRLWMQICANGEAFLEYMRETAKPLLDTRDDKQRMDAMNTKAKALEQMTIISDRIDALMSKFTGGDDDLAKSIGTFRRITPEAVAKMKLNV